MSTVEKPPAELEPATPSSLIGLEAFASRSSDGLLGR